MGQSCRFLLVTGFADGFADGTDRRNQSFSQSNGAVCGSTSKDLRLKPGWMKIPIDREYLRAILMKSDKLHGQTENKGERLWESKV
jgi:hypothetical protein